MKQYLLITDRYDYDGIKINAMCRKTRRFLASTITYRATCQLSNILIYALQDHWRLSFVVFEKLYYVYSSIKCTSVMFLYRYMSACWGDKEFFININ